MEGLGALRVSLARRPSRGFLGAFANLYNDSFDDMVARACGASFELRGTIYPNAYDGLEGVHFIQQCLASHGENGAWKPLRAEFS